MKKHRRMLLLLVCLFALAAAALAGCGRSGTKSEADTRTDQNTLAENDTEQEETGPESLDSITLETLVSALLDDMTLEQKIGQMFIVDTDSLDFNAEEEMTDAMREAIETYQPGGVIFFSFNLKDRDQISSFITDMQDASAIPMFLSVDEEGGDVSRLANIDAMELTRFPPMSEVGETGDTDEAYRVGATIGSEISALGFNLDFAPVADITTNEENTEIGTRSFGSDASLVSDMATEVVKGLQDNGVSAAMKHFPGQGDSGEDTHRGYVNLDVTIDRLRKTEFKPFQAGISAGVDFIMMSHVSVSPITQSDVPASLSSLMVTDILRDELNYDNVIITDAMNMKIITKFYDAGQAAVLAVKAGNDMILMPDDFAEAFDAVCEAVSDGTITERSINASVRRILEVKIRRGIIPLDSPAFADILD